MFKRKYFFLWPPINCHEKGTFKTKIHGLTWGAIISDGTLKKTLKCDRWYVYFRGYVSKKHLRGLPGTFIRDGSFIS